VPDAFDDLHRAWHFNEDRFSTDCDDAIRNRCFVRFARVHMPAGALVEEPGAGLEPATVRLQIGGSTS
jgi:hypothetical protein